MQPSSEEIRTLLQCTIDAIEDAIRIISPNYEILYMNRTAEKRADRVCDAVIGKLCYEELEGQIRPCAHCALRSVMESGRSKQIEYVTAGPEGQQRTYEQFVYPLRNRDGSLIGVVEVTSDLTDSRAFDRHLQHREKLAALGQLSAAVAHEIRNPLAGIRLGIDSLLEDTKRSKTRETLEMISEDIRRLDRTLGQLLDFSRRKEPKRELLPVGDLIEQSLSLVRKPASYQKVNVKLTVQKNLPHIKADPDQIQQVLLNLFLNAIQAMPDGGMLQVGAKQVRHDERNGILITVRDTGQGIPKEASGKLFAMFFTTKPSGSGIGLAVSNRIVSEHGGALWMQNIEGNGALVSIFLPIESADDLA